MNLKNTFPGLFLGFAAAVAISASAADKPEILTIPASNAGGLTALSPNGLWAVGDALNISDSSKRGYPRLVNTQTGEEFLLWTPDEEKMGVPLGANAVSDDGKVVGGNYMDLPAVWKEGQGWLYLDMPKGKYNNGLVSAITPDGRYGVGRVSVNLFTEFPCVWDLETLEIVKTPNMVDFNPKYKHLNAGVSDPDDMYYTDELNVRLTGISPDGNAIIGMVDFIYPAACWEFVYYRDSDSWHPLGMTFDGDDLIPLNSDIDHVEGARFSPDGMYIGGSYYSRNDTPVPFYCKTSDLTHIVSYPDTDNMLISAVGNDAILYGAAPVNTPLRDWSARVGDYWYDWKSALKQTYGIDWRNDITKDDTGYSGTVSGVSNDGKTILATDYGNKTSYVITLPKTMEYICSDVDLLADYVVSPVDGAQFSLMQTVSLSFSRDVEVAAEKTDATLLDENGEAVRSSINFTLQTGSTRRVDVTFRNFRMEAGKKYTVVIPAGAIQVAGDPDRSNSEIRVSYIGRPDTPVAPISVFPEDGATLPRLNYTSNPILVSFDAIIDATGKEGAEVSLYQVKDGQEEYLYPLNAAISGSQMIVYPVSEQRLADGYDYIVKFDEGIVADLSGAGANKPFSVTYHGSYVPEIDPTSNVIFSNQFEGTLYEMLLFEGDHNTPTVDMQYLSFDADNTPWQFVRDDEADEDGYYNYAAMSHSMYDPAGKSEDWMVTPQLFIPDDKAVLSFKSQGYLKSKQDRLKVYVWESKDILTNLTSGVVDQIHYNGDCVYDEIQDPGENEATLIGDWTENTISLEKYAGKTIYIAFLNDNQNQSIVFVDDILVSREVVALLSVDNETTLINADDIVIRGRAQIEKTDGLDSFTVSLLDADGNEIETLSESNHFDKGAIYNYEFSKPVALEKGCSNIFTVLFRADDREVAYNVDIKNMMFRTNKRIVVEENTGTGCQYCPLGILGMENMQKVYGDRLIPVAIHGYTGGDAFITPELIAYSQYFGLIAAPTGVVNRGVVCNPMYQDPSGSDYSFTAPDALCWIDQAEVALKTLADADVDINSFRIEDNKVKIDFDVVYALDRKNANINVFAVIMEDDLFSLQTNGLTGATAPSLGEWANGGAYDKRNVLWYYDDVVRGTSAVAVNGDYTGFNGTAGYIPSSIVAGEKIPVNFEFALPNNIENEANTKVCVMLVDANTGALINAAVSGKGSSAVDGIQMQMTEGVVYDLTGRIVLRDASIEDLHDLQPGIYIFNGRKFAVR